MFNGKPQASVSEFGTACGSPLNDQAPARKSTSVL
jgi:hypothetical protein